MLKPTATVPVSTQGRHGDGSWCKYKQMIPLNLPSFNIKTKVQGGRTLVFDFLRRRYVTLTPEEWVRQHFVHFLVEHKGYPAALLGNEVGLKVGGVSRRCDSVLYHRDGGRPRAIVEYKAPLCLSRSRFSRKLPPTTVFSELIISSSRTESTTIAATLITRPETWNICAKSRLIQN